ncbi:hypothetical protein JCM6882_009611 [Rhodosporidiobolus microsporus]
MAPPTPGRHRGPRPQVNNNIGEAGRTTNVVPPKYVPRDSAGHERAEDFFDRAANGGTYDDDDDEMYEPEPVAKAKQSAKKKAVVNGAREKRGERPDRYMLGEDRGRKTGVVKALSQRDAEGFEDVNNFFQSPSPTRSTATAKSTVKSRKNGQTLFNPPSPEYEGGDFDEDESDMMVDDGTSLSPLTYQRLHPSSARQPSSLRHSTAASGHESTSRRGLATSSPNSPRKSAPGGGGAPSRRRLSSLSGSGDEAAAQDDDERFDFPSAYEEEQDESDDEAEEDEVVRATLGAGRYASANGSAKKLDKGKGRAVVRSDDEDDEDDERDYADDYDADETSSRRKSIAATSTKKKKKKPAAPRASGASSAASPTAAISTGLMKLDKNGRPVPVTTAADRKGKGKEVVRSPSPQQDAYYDDDFGGGFDEYDRDGAQGEGVDEEGFPQYDEEDFEGEGDDEDLDAPGPSSRPSKEKKGKAAKAPAKKAKAKAGRRESDSPGPRKAAASQGRKRPLDQGQERVVEQVSRKRQREGGTVDVDGVRRSTRQRVEPLEYWRNERVIYRRRQSGIGMNAIVRVPKEEPLPLTKAGKKPGSKRGSSARPHSARAASVKQEVPEEEGCDDMTDPDGLVWSWEGNAEHMRRVAFTAKMMDPKPTFDGTFAFQKIYQELDYLAGGVMVIPPGKAKGLKPSKDNSYIFYCIQGSVSVTVHRAIFTVGPGGTFFVPRGNSYSIKATSDREVRLFFAQGRRVLEFPNGDTRADTMDDSQQFVQQELDAVPEEDEEEEEEEEEE